MILELDLAHWDQRLDQIRNAIMAEERSHQLLEREINLAVGQVREQVAGLLGEIDRLEARLLRLETSSSVLSDDELDDEDLDERAENAAFWAEWRQQREDRVSNNGRQRPGNRSLRRRALRERYRALARLIHPDLAPTAEGRAQREDIMRIANEAYEAGDQAQIERLFKLWSQTDRSDSRTPTIDRLQEILAQKKSEHDQLRRQLRQLERSELGLLVRADSRKRKRDIRKEAERLRRELAALRLRRRRLLRNVDSLRQELSEISD